MASSKQDLNFVPKNYDELYSHYFKGGVVQMLLRQFLKHGTEEEFQTLEQDIFLRLLDKDMIKKFDPTKSNFGGVIFFTTRTIAVNYLDRKTRDPLGLLKAGTLTETSEDENPAPGTYALDRFFTGRDTTAAQVEAREQVEALMAVAKGDALRGAHLRDKSLVQLINLLAQEYTPDECSEALGVSLPTIRNWIRYLVSEAGL